MLKIIIHIPFPLTFFGVSSVIKEAPTGIIKPTFKKIKILFFKFINIIFRIFIILYKIKINLFVLPFKPIKNLIKINSIILDAINYNIKNVNYKTKPVIKLGFLPYLSEKNPLLRDPINIPTNTTLTPKLIKIKLINKLFIKNNK